MKGELKMSDKQKEGVAAVGFLIMAFTDEKAGDEAIKAMKEAKKKKEFYFEEAAVIRQDVEGKITYKETGDMKAGKGAKAGALIGGIIGVLGGPAGVVVGSSAGAALGAMASKGDAGFRDESLKMVGMGLKPGTSAVTAITSSTFLKAVQTYVDVEDIRQFVSNLASHIYARLNEGKSVALGILLTEKGLAFKEVAVDENSAEVIGMAITDEAVVAGAAVVTADRVDYTVAGVTAEGAVVETGVVTKDGALIVDSVMTPEGEATIATAIIPELADEASTSEEKPKEPGETEDKKTKK
jgi:uncharacterized membrane protein